MTNVTGVAARLTGPTAQAALDLAVAGPRPDVLAAMSASAGWCAGDLDPLLQGGLVEVDADRRLRFADDTARDLVLAAAPPATVCSTHRRAAAVCRELNLPGHQLVGHLVASTMIADADVAAGLEEAALRAEAEGELRVASDAWRAAAQLSPTAPERVTRAVRGLRLVIVSGLDYAGVDVLVDLLSGEQLSSECACWVEWLKALRRSELSPDSAVTAQWSTITRARDAAPGTLRALLWDAAMNAWTLGDAAAGLRAAREYAELEASMTGDEAGVEAPWTGTALLAAGLFEVGEVEEAAQLRRAAITSAKSADPTVIGLDRLVSIVFLDDVLLDMSPEAGNRLQVCMERSADESATHACLLGIAAWRARARGDWAVADQLLARGRPLATATGATGAQSGMAALTVELAAMRGKEDVLRAEAESLRTRANRVGDRRRLATVDRALGLHALAAGRLDEAVVRLAGAADVPFLGRGLRDGVVPARVDMVEALTRQGDVAGARARADAVRPILVAMDDPLAAALERRVAALVAGGDEAIECYRQGLALHRECSESFERARTLLLLGEHERRSRRRLDARMHLIEAVDAFEGLDAGPWLARARNELRAVGGRVDPGVGDVRLTGQELAVAQKAAQGLTTREVADALFLSPRTVEFHLGNVYRKLGVHGRAALATRLEAFSPAQ